MGRKPNPVISKYFRRGDKLGDASNRYQYTCKKCGERFPKGRIEGLQNHVTKRCALLSLKEKSDLALEIHNHGIAALAAATAAKIEPKTGKRKRTTLPGSAPQQQNFNRLNVLADVVSKQNSHSRCSVVGDGQSMVLDPGLTDEDFSNSIEDEGLDRENAIFSSGSASGAAISSVRALPRHAMDNTSLTAELHSHSQHHGPHSSQVARLTSIAVSASATLADSIAPVPSHPVLEKRPDSGNHPVATTATSKHGTISLPVIFPPNRSWDLAKDGKLLEQHKAVSYPRPIAMHPDMLAIDLPCESSQDLLTDKKQARAPFTEARRNEVQKMRQIGSCIRCRMLRKSCSENTPCVTCADRNSSRNWKGFPCLRTKVVDLYQGYLLGLYQAVSIRSIDAAGSTIGLVPSLTKLLIQYFDSSDSFMLSALQSDTNDSAVCSTPSTLSSGQGASKKILIIDNEANDIPAVLEAYLEHKIPCLIEQESSAIIKSAASHLHQLSRDSKDELTKNVLTLWMLTTILSDSTKPWKISILQPPPQDSTDQTTTPSSPLTQQNEPQSHTLITSQLHSTLDRLASKSYTSTVHKFERRLCRLQPVNHFHTFLAAVLLINSIERHAWLLHSWTTEDWPLPDDDGTRTQASLLAQAEEMANVLSGMSKVRYLNAGISETARGGAGVAKEGVLKANHPTDKNGEYASWFDEIGLTLDFLTSRQEALFDSQDCRSWDLKWAAPLLMPSTTTTTVTTATKDTVQEL